MRSRTKNIFLIVVLPLLLAACGGTDEVYTRPPRAADYSDADALPVAAHLTVALRAASPLPADVRALRFRLRGMTLHPAADTAEAYRLGSAEVSVGDGVPGDRVLLQAHVPPVRYDRLTFALTDARVRFGPNAGGPLVAGGDTVRVPLASFAPDDSARLRLSFNAAASLQRTDDCRWRFAPRFTAEP